MHQKISILSPKKQWGEILSVVMSQCAPSIHPICVQEVAVPISYSVIHYFYQWNSQKLWTPMQGLLKGPVIHMRYIGIFYDCHKYISFLNKAIYFNLFFLLHFLQVLCLNSGKCSFSLEMSICSDGLVGPIYSIYRHLYLAYSCYMVPIPLIYSHWVTEIEHIYPTYLNYCLWNEFLTFWTYHTKWVWCFFP